VTQKHPYRTYIRTAWNLVLPSARYTGKKYGVSLAAQDFQANLHIFSPPKTGKIVPIGSVSISIFKFRNFFGHFKISNAKVWYTEASPAIPCGSRARPHFAPLQLLPMYQVKVSGQKSSLFPFISYANDKAIPSV